VPPPFIHPFSPLPTSFIQTKALKKKPQNNALKKNPVLNCCFPESESLQKSIFSDGHHSTNPV